MTQLKVAILLCIIAFVCIWNYVEGNKKGSCPKRDKAAAAVVGRRCRRSCTRRKTCGSGRLCMCAHECGWSCIRLSNPCQLPPNIGNMAGVEITRKGEDGGYLPVLPPYQFDDRAKYICKPGYRLENADPERKNLEAEHLCTGRQVWTNEGASICARACRQRNFRKVTEISQRCTDTCQTDSDCAPGSQCLCDGYCGRSCVNPDVDCGEVHPSGNSIITYDESGFNRVAYYACNEGFYISSGTPSRKCTAGGTWDGRPVICERVQCVDPESAINAQNGYISEYRPPPYYVGDELRFKCRPDYHQLGAKNRTCMSNGRWSGVDTVCDRIRRQDEGPRCPHPGIPIGGHAIPRTLSYRHFNKEDIVRFECDSHLVMVGEAVQECLYFYQWSDNGAPQCVDPRYRDSDTSVITKLTQSTSNIKASLPSVGRFIGSGADANHEIYFLFDLSNSVTDKDLNHSLTFAVKLIQRLTANASGIIKYGVMVFALEPMTIVDTQDAQPTVDKLIQKIINIGLDRQSIQQEIRSGTNTEKVLRELANQMEFSYAAEENDDTSIERHVFILTDGQHNEGGPPQREVCRLKKRDNPPTFYSITSCVECASEVTGNQAYTELLGLAEGKLENYIVIANFYLISELLDRVTDARIDYAECGQAGDVGSVKQQARIGRVIGGTRASTRAWPWQVVITLKDDLVFRAYSKDAFYGGGSLINNRWVLTAAHLFGSIDRGLDWEEGFLLTFGIHSLPLARRDLLSTKVKTFTSSKIIEHSDFGIASNYDLDIALIKIGQEYEQVRTQFSPTPNFGFVNYTEYIRPVCMPCVPGNCVEQYLLEEKKLVGNETFEERCTIETEFLLSEGAEDKILAVATGFGYVKERQDGDLSDPTPSQTLQQGLLRIRSNEHCSEFTSEHIPWVGDDDDNAIPPIPYTDHMLCATSGIVGPTIDTCQGDSGGPLVREISYVTENDRKTCWVQIGIVSWGWGCGQSLEINGVEMQVPGYYTNVMSVSSWIRNTMAKEGACRQRDVRKVTEINQRCTDTCQADNDCAPGSQCLCDGYCGRSCVNPDVNCGEAPPAGNSTITYDGSGFNRVAYYACNEGFYISSGTPSRKCTAGGTWEGPPVICEPVQCVGPEGAINAQNGNISENRPPPSYVGDELSFECRPGYQQVGAKNRTCMSNGRWSGVDTVCDRIPYAECGQAGDVGNVKKRARIGRVIGGTRASLSSWPWQVVITWKKDIVFKSYANDSFFGGGSLINHRWVLTAAHLFGTIKRKHGWEEGFLLTFGLNRLPLARSDLLSAEVKIFTSSKIIEHIDFGIASDFDLDVALIKIGQEFEQDSEHFRPTQNFGFVNYTEYIRPVCMPCVRGSSVEQYLLEENKLVGNETFEKRCAIETEFLLSKGKKQEKNKKTRKGAKNKIIAVATGFGHVKERSHGDAAIPSQTLQQGLLRIRSNEQCLEFTSEHIPWDGPPIPYTDNMLCAISGIKGSTIDSCQGDSGGPLVREVSYVTESGRKKNWVQIGIVSWGWGCGQSLKINGAEKQVPGYYTNVMSVSSWIKNTMETEDAANP